MKWIRRKPSSLVDGIVLLTSIAILFGSAGVINDMYPGYRSRLENWILPLPGAYPIGPFPPVLIAPDRFTQNYWVFNEDGQYLVLVSASVTAQDVASDPEAVEMIYVAGTYRSGLWAPTMAFDAKLLGHPIQIWTVSTGGPQSPWMERIQEVRGVVVASEGLDPRLATAQQIADERIIWSGYVINALCVIAMLGIVWSLAWVPAQRRDRRGLKRLARGQCPMCAYDLEATPGRCPECGWGHEGEGTGDVSGENGA